MEIHIVGESIKFMLLGMMVVYVFLIVMIQVMKLQAKIINKFFSTQASSTPSSSSATTPIQSEENKGHHVAAIIAAITEFRKQS
ncbi:MAG: hypothetical protein RL113_440 [Pseudomonadota bacterium]|jgi:oxaloacetate decarboxylase gamma subunit